MRKILIISYYFPPCNGTPSPRPYSWANYFGKKGFDVTVVTRYWDDNGNDWQDYLSSTQEVEPKFEEIENFKIWWLPFKEISYRSNRLSAKWDTIFNLLKGNLEREADTLQFAPFCKELLSKERFDLVVTSAPPWNMVKLGYEISKKFGIPHIPDFRDFENDMTLNPNPKASWFRKIEFYINRYYMFKWIKSAPFIVSASKALGDYITSRIGIKNIEILNGYEKSKLESLVGNPPNKKMTVSVIGYIYPAQPLDILYAGIRTFLQKHKSPKIQFNFIGQNGVPAVAREMEENIPKQYISITDRKPPEVANQIGKDSDVLFYAGWKGWKGVYSAKLATYLGLQKFILIAPGDGDVIDKIIAHTGAGKVVNEAEEFCNTLSLLYNEWEQNGFIRYSGDLERIEKFSREHQASIFLKKIVQLLN